MSIKHILKQFWTDEEGQSLSEYGLILALVAIAAITALTALSDQIQNVFQTIVDALPGGG